MMFKNVRNHVVCSFLNGHGSDGVEYDGLHLVVGAEQADQGLRHHSHLTREYWMIYRGPGPRTARTRLFRLINRQKGPLRAPFCPLQLFQIEKFFWSPPRAARVKVVYFTVLLNHRDQYSTVFWSYLWQENICSRKNPRWRKNPEIFF